MIISEDWLTAIVYKISCKLMRLCWIVYLCKNKFFVIDIGDEICIKKKVDDTQKNGQKTKDHYF